MSDTPETDEYQFSDSPVLIINLARRLERERDEARRSIDNLCKDWAESDTFIEEICRKNGVPELEITGDSYGVPGIEDKVESLVRVLTAEKEAGR